MLCDDCLPGIDLPLHTPKQHKITAVMLKHVYRRVVITVNGKISGSTQ